MTAFLQIIDRAPATIACACIALAALLVWIFIGPRRRGIIIAIAVLLPALPTILLRLMGTGLVAAADELELAIPGAAARAEAAHLLDEALEEINP